MLEATLQEAGLLKKLLDAFKEPVTDASFECHEDGINVQAMDNSHVALVMLYIRVGGFKQYRCDQPISLGVHLDSLAKVLDGAKDDDVCTLKANEADILNLVFEAKNSGRVSEYRLKLNELDFDSLGIPAIEYEARVTMPSTEFSRIMKHLSLLGESLRIEVSKEGVRFVSGGETTDASVLLKQTEGSIAGGRIVADVEEEEEEDEAEGEGEDVKPAKEDEGKVMAASSDNAQTKKSDDEDDASVLIEMNQPVSCTFGIKHLVNFSKSAASLASRVRLMMSNQVPLLVAYEFNQGHLRYYLAPKREDD